MKTNPVQQIGLFSMLVLIFGLAYTQPQNELLLPFALHDSVATNVAANKSTKTVIPLQSHFKSYVNRYLDENAEILDHIWQTNGAKLASIQQVLVKGGIPPEMMYLAIVESELKNSATSSVGAAGIWQLMPETARTFGLKVNGKTDERRQVNRSSVAAAKYLNELYNQFDDWLLVVAAYNCGAGQVFKAIKKSGSRDFWKLQAFLPAQSRSHVKHFIATHFYYEQSGSIVTLTKKERLRYLASLNSTAVEKNDSASASTNDSCNQATNPAAVLISLKQ